MPAPNRYCQILFLLLSLGAVPVARANADPVILSFDAVFSDPISGTATDNDLAVAAGAEITLASGTNVGAGFFDDEFVDLESSTSVSTLAYRVQGGAGAHPLNGAYSLTGWDALTTLTFSDFQLDSVGDIINVSLSVALISGQPTLIGAGGGALTAGVDYIFDPVADSLTLFLGDLGVLDATAPPLGTMTFTLDFEGDGETPPPAPVPEPGSLALLGTGLAVLGSRWRRRTRTPQRIAKK